MKHGIPEPIDLTWLYVATMLAVTVGAIVFAYFAFGECTRVHPFWYCLLR